MSICMTAGMNLIQSRYKPHRDPIYPGYDQCVETCARVISCNESGRIDALYLYINLLDKWLKKVGMHTQIRKYILQYAKRRGRISMVYVLHGTSRRYRKLAASQELIGWRRFMEGMISK